MRNFTLLLILFSLLTQGSVSAQTTGVAAVETVETASEGSWQNWVFAGSAILTAAGAIFVVTMNNGKKVQSTSSS